MQPVSEFSSFVRLIFPLCIYIYCILFIHSFISAPLGGFYLLAVGDNAAMNTRVQSSEPMFSLFLGIHPEVELLDHVVILRLNF